VLTLFLASSSPAMAADDEKPPPQRPGSNNGRSSPVDLVLRETQYFYAVVLLAAFIGCAAWYSVYNAKKDEDLVQPLVKGPGGKPLPITKRKKRDNGERKIGPRFGRAAKNVFRYLAGVVFLAYVASGAATFIHAFYHENPYKWSRDGLPWAGEWTVVCYPTIHQHTSPWRWTLVAAEFFCSSWRGHGRASLDH